MALTTDERAELRRVEALATKPMAGVTFRHLDTPEAQEAALEELMKIMGFRTEVVAGEEFLVPIDPAHPDFAKAMRRIERARRKAGV